MWYRQASWPTTIRAEARVIALIKAAITGTRITHERLGQDLRHRENDRDRKQYRETQHDRAAEWTGALWHLMPPRYVGSSGVDAHRDTPGATRHRREKAMS
jgi:hypothetical protein